jgi:hypothetical protein
MPAPARRDRWRRLLAPPQSGLESSEGDDDASERVERAHEALERLITDRFGADPGLLRAAQEIALTAVQAVDVLDLDSGSEPSDEQFAALEAVVAFDGTRPSFLVKQDEVDFDSSFNTGMWEFDLKPLLAPLAALIGCTGRVELGEKPIGTASLVTPILAVTNRHVAQAIAGFADRQIVLKPGVNLDFGREEWNGRQSFDRRAVQSVAFAGAQAIGAPLDHRKLDLAVLRVSPSTLGGELGKRHLEAGQIDADAFRQTPFVGAVGYPSNPTLYAPPAIRTKFDDVLRRLLEGDGGAKRFAPGVPTELTGVGDDVKWTVCHDATTINGNSGSPLLTIGGARADRVSLAGLHYAGSWGGDRVNWAHLLSAVANGTGYGTEMSFADFCDAEGIALHALRPGPRRA